MSERWTRLVTALLALLWSTPALAQVQPESHWWAMPRDVSVEGHRIDWLINITLVFSGILMVIVILWIGIAIFRHGRDHEALYDHGNATKQMFLAIGLSALIFAVIDGNLWVNSLIDLDEVYWNWDKPLSDPQTVRIEINAHQWAWDARYAGPDDEFATADDIVQLNEIRVPLNRPIFIQLSSTDVIHAFNLPNFRVKQDAVPGDINPFWFEAAQVGEYDIACAEHCGAHHYKMKGRLIVMEQDAWDAWHDEAAIRAELAYNPDDSGAHWGWPWEEDF